MKKRQRHAHQITPISSLFREQRLRRGWSQEDMASRLSTGKVSITDNQISRVELGRQIPGDDWLISFAEVCQLDIAKVIAARDGIEPGSAVMPIAAPVAPVSEAPPVPVAAPSFPDSAERFAQFTEELFAVVPPPLDREKRKEWFRLAARLYQLSEG